MCCFITKYLGIFPAIFLLLISSLIPLCSEIRLSMISILLNLLRLKMWSILVNVPWELQNNVFSAVTGWSEYSINVN